jgi:hypothetical protein
MKELDWIKIESKDDIVYKKPYICYQKVREKKNIFANQKHPSEIGWPFGILDYNDMYVVNPVALCIRQRILRREILVHSYTRTSMLALVLQNFLW